MNTAEESWTLRRVMTKLLDEERTGVLDVASAGATTRIHVRKGNVVQVERRGQENLSPLADYLIEAGRLTVREVVEAREKSSKVDMALDEYLVSRHLASEDQAKRHADLYTSDLLFSLFTLESLTVTFKDERPRTSAYGTQLPISFVLKEAERRNAEWPELRRRVGSVRSVYAKEPDVVGQILGYVKANNASAEAANELSGTARVVIFHANGVKTVEQLGRSTGLGLFETYRGLRELLDADLVELVAREGVGEQPPAQEPRIASLVSALIVTTVAALVGLGIYWSITKPESFRSDVPAISDAQAEIAAQAHVVNVRMALEIHHAWHRSYPDALNGLSEGFGLGPATRQAIREMAYSNAPQGYTLHHPAASRPRGQRTPSTVSGSGP